MKEGWEIKKLSSTFNIKSSRRVHQSDWQQQGIPFYRAREVVLLSKCGFVNNELFISEKLYGEFTKIGGAPKYGDLIVSAVGTLGCCYQVKVDDKFYFKDASVLWFEKKSAVNSRFIEYAFKSDGIMSQISAGSVGATVGTLTINRAKELKIPIPPLSEQQRIVSIIDEAFEAIDKAIENTQKNLQNAKELFECYLNSVFENGGEGWEEKTLKEVCAKITDGTHQTPKYFDDGVIFLSSRNVTTGKIDWDNIKYIDEKQHLEMHKRVAPRVGDILLAKNGTTGVAAIVDRNIVFDIYVSLAHIRVLDQVTPEFMLYFINSPLAKKQFNKRLKGSGVPNLHLEEIREVSILFPKSKIDQKSIVEQLDAMRAETQSMELVYKKKINNLEELKKSVLNKAFAGEL
jgi:type I restriction enzyme S subunit